MKYLSTFILLFLSICSFSQVNDTLTSKTGYVKYTYKIQKSPFSEFTDANAFLNFNETESVFVSGRFGMDEKSNLGQIKSSAKSVGYIAPTSSEKGHMIYRNFTTKEIIYNEFKLAVFPPYTVKDNWVEMEWKTFDDTKEIAGYQTKKATTTFRGSDYTVWYSEQIPFPYGPMKVFGLPGIILELTVHNIGEDKRDLTYTAYDVCYPCDNNQKVEQPVEDVVKTIEEEVQFKDNFQYYFNTEFNKKMGDKGILYMDEAPTERKIRDRRKQMAEKIYEWENKDTKRLLQGIDYTKMVDPYKKEKKSNSVPINTFPDRPEPIQRPNL